VDRLEISIDGPFRLPWNLLCDEPPIQAAFMEADPGQIPWSSFWGARYNLSITRQSSPLQRMPILLDPRVLIVVDEDVYRGLPESQQERLRAFCKNIPLPPVRSVAELDRAVRAGRPDFMYFFCHGSTGALYLDGEVITPLMLFDMLSRAGGEEQFGGVVFLNTCDTALAGESTSFLSVFHELGVSGVVGADSPVISTIAAPLGLDFLEGFLYAGEPIGPLVQRLRLHYAPSSLAYVTSCPPNVRVVWSSPPPAVPTAPPSADTGDEHDAPAVL
jgi:hypothetical protein